MMAIPVLDVDQELVLVVQDFAANYLELGDLYDRAARMHSFGYNFQRLTESFARGLQGDFRGGVDVGLDEINRIEKGEAETTGVRAKLRKCILRLNQVRARLTATYGVEFEVPK